MLRTFFIITAVFLLSGCDSTPPEALGTLERDRINCRAAASERVISLDANEGDFVAKNTLLLRLDDRKIAAAIEVTTAELEQARWLLKELEAGPRPETIGEAEARVNGARAMLENEQAIFTRRKQLLEKNVTSQEQFDIAKKNYLNARSYLAEQENGLALLVAGTRKEQIEQVRYKIKALENTIEGQLLLQADYSIRAPRQGRVESLPFKEGDRPEKGAVTATLLTGKQPWARIYIPEPYRSSMVLGKTYPLHIDGQPEQYRVKLRTISAEASFTPYFALNEKNRSSLCYVAKFDFLDDKTGDLTAGTPVQLLLH